MLGLALVLAVPAGATAQATDSLSASRRVVAAASLAAAEYGLGVAPEGGRLVLAAEVEEARLFIDQARHDVALLPAASRAAADSLFRRIAGAIDRLAAPADV